MRVAVITGFKLLANILHARIYTHTCGRMHTGRHKRTERCEWVKHGRVRRNSGELRNEGVQRK